MPHRGLHCLDSEPCVSIVKDILVFFVKEAGIKTVIAFRLDPFARLIILVQKARPRGSRVNENLCLVRTYDISLSILDLVIEKTASALFQVDEILAPRAYDDRLDHFS